jgi:hypothetical protein
MKEKGSIPGPFCEELVRVLLLSREYLRQQACVRWIIYPINGFLKSK